MEETGRYSIHNEESDRRSKDADMSVDWELIQPETVPDDDVPFHIPRD